MLHRLILKVSKFQLSLPKGLSTVVKNILRGHHAPPCQVGLKSPWYIKIRSRLCWNITEALYPGTYCAWCKTCKHWRCDPSLFFSYLTLLQGPDDAARMAFLNDQQYLGLSEAPRIKIEPSFLDNTSLKYTVMLNYNLSCISSCSLKQSVEKHVGLKSGEKVSRNFVGYCTGKWKTKIFIKHHHNLFSHILCLQ